MNDEICGFQGPYNPLEVTETVLLLPPKGVLRAEGGLMLPKTSHTFPEKPKTPALRTPFKGDWSAALDASGGLMWVQPTGSGTRV